MQTALSKFLAVSALVVTLAGPASAARQIVVGGDITGTFNLGDPLFGGIAGNRTLFDRARAGSSRVLISTNSFNSFSQGNLLNFYSGLPGVTASVLSGPLDGGLDPGVGLLVVQVPQFALTSAEIAAVSEFVRGGGNLLLLGESAEAQTIFPGGPVPQGTISNGILNALLAGIGSDIRLANDSIGCCGNLVTTEILPSPLTVGITSFGYGFVSSVTGGEGLIQVPRGFSQPAPATFFATETLAVGGVIPEPMTWAMMVVGLGLVGVAARRAQVTDPARSARG